jgi:large conductance mechanosensitive channel
MIKDFKAFVLKGNVVDLAVAVVIGAAFGKVIDAVVKGLLTPLIAIPGKTNFGDLEFAIRQSHFFYGAVINEIISFVLIAAAVFFFVVKPMNALIARRNRGETADPDPTTRDCPFCLSVIPLAATRCAHCTSEVNTA